MQRVGVRELRQHASRYLAQVKSGESIEITERGELVALLTPPDPPYSARERLRAAGKLLPPVSSSGRLRRPQPKLVVQGKPSNQALLDAERGEEP
ncbi:MAG: type II toxin-antitoxin system prevent-host-death family antitoxin [Actinobacteria bacterium]|jgi:prevent-host-death family protein|nr:type II toxin-antitoxin system prevent-host-death family antitoxin [Actinomycetota bacterium]